MVTGVVPNALCDVMLLVGLDDNTGLNPIVKPLGNSVQELLSQEFCPQVLSALSATDMVNFNPTTHKVSGYPMDPNKIMVSRMPASDQQVTMASSPAGHGHQSRRPVRSQSVNPRIFTRHMSIRRPQSIKPPSVLPELPISEERLNSIPYLCFPEGMRVYRSKPSPLTHFLILTDMNGGYSYATCLTFFRSFLVETDDQGNVYVELDQLSGSQNLGQDQGHNLAPDQVRCFIPQCCVLISQFPYFTQMKDCLSSLYHYISQDPEEMISFIKEYAQILTNIPVPPAGNISVELNLYNLPMILMPPSYPGKPVVDFPLHIIFLCFRTEEFLKIISAVLRQERVVFLSSNHALTTFVMEGVRNLILPFQWRFTYAPVLPDIEYLQALCPFLLGCRSDFKKEAEQVPGLVLVDIDRGEVSMTTDSSVSMVTDLGIPAECANAFLAKSRRLKLNFDLLETQRPSCFDISDLRRQKRELVLKQNTFISQACLELMVNLFRGVVYKLSVEHQHFNREQFLNEQPPDDRDFYDKVFETDMFIGFLKQRTEEVQDYWYDLEIKTRTHGQTKSTTTGGSLNKRGLRKQHTISQIFPVQEQDFTAYKLPDTMNRENYRNVCIKQLSKLYKDSPDYDDRNSYLYLLAMFHVANGNKMDAIDDFISLSTANQKILPVNVLRDLFYKMTPEEVTLFKRKQGHELLLDIIEADSGMEGHSEHGLRRVRMDPITIPDRDLSFEEFKEYVSLEMTNDFDTIRRLFDALNGLEKLAYVDKATFQLFVASWNANQDQCDSVKVEDRCLTEEENILKVSSVSKTDFGLGRIVLTDRRLFFLSDGSNQFREIVKLRDIVSLTRKQQQSILTTAETLVIEGNRKTFIAHLKEDCQWWYYVIQEVSSGKIVAESTLDTMAVTQAVQNTLLINAVYGSGLDINTSHHETVADSVKILCYYTQYKEAGKHILPEDTLNLLKRKIDPNIGEKERKTIQAILYMGEEECASMPRLWCALNSGKIKVFNAVTFQLDTEFVQAKQCVACLTSVGGNQVWAGSYGIYIIDPRTITCSRTLLDHSEMVVDIIQQDKYVFTASLDGVIIKWDFKKLTHAAPKIELQKKVEGFKYLRSLKVHEGLLFCGTWSNVLMCDGEGNPMSTFSIRDPDDTSRTIDLDSFTILTNGQIWAGSRRKGLLTVWDHQSLLLRKQINIYECKGISIMVEVDGRLWVGTKGGRIVIYNIRTGTLWKELQAHEDAVRVLCAVRDRYIISGGGSMDGKACIWNASPNTTDSGSFLELSNSMAP